MIRLQLTCAALAVLAACSPRSNPEDAVRAQLRDPASAVFTDVRQMPDGSVCGVVNSKNGFGGYAGAARFIVPGKAPHTLELDPKDGLNGSAVFDIDYTTWCSGVPTP